EGMIDSVIDAQAVFGTAENRLEIQNEFMSTLIDSFKSGIGTLVDADLEEASARLQSLQVQQQLGTQALSIANQAPQSILALFR
ncbi:MAG: flagellin, partial [Pseudomonadota bacterium]